MMKLNELYKAMSNVVNEVYEYYDCPDYSIGIQITELARGNISVVGNSSCDITDNKHNDIEVGIIIYLYSEPTITVFTEAPNYKSNIQFSINYNDTQILNELKHQLTLVFSELS